MISLTVPCFDEEQRLDERALDRLLEDPDVELVLVDDGSRDHTLKLLRAYEERHGRRVHVVALSENRGKAEAVRVGLRAGVDAGAAVVGYLDADFATPPGEMLRLLDLLRERPELLAALGSRVARLGAQIERRARRHYAGRVFATVASLALGVPVYDTQCGAKAFRVDDELRAALAEPFRSPWVFDVDLLDRVLGRSSGREREARAARIVEVPLGAWRDVAGSKLKTRDMVHAAVDVARILARRR